MKSTKAEDSGQRLEVDPGQLSGNGWRRRIGVPRGKPWILKLLMLGILVAAGAWALYANLSPGRSAMDMSTRVTSGNTPFPVLIVPVERGTITGTVTYTGSVLPLNEEDIYPRVTGRIVEMLVYPGDPVRPGQVLARLDSVELSSKVREAEAGLAAARANRVQAEKELAAMVAEAGYARAVADRTARLFNTGAVSRQELENDSAAAVAVEAKVDAARARIEAATSMLAQSEAVLRTATTVRDYVTIVASSPGYVVKRLVAPGVLVQPGMAILKVAQIDRVRLQANVGERDLSSIRVGSAVQVTTPSAAQLPITARVTSVFPFVDQGPRTGVVEALVDNAARRFLPGQYVTMRFVTGERADALMVPAPAVVRMGGKAMVWIAKEGRAEPRAVTTGLESPNRVEIRDGLTGDERVIASGSEALYAGARVADVSGPAPGSSPAPEEQKDMPGMPGMKQPTEKPSTPKGGAHGSH
jgi:RND family efflux transporter MFP subunit